jgi:hypothetical protein
MLDLFIALAIRLRIERCENFKAFFLEASIRKQRETEIAKADEDHGLKTGRAEFIRDTLGKFGDIVTQTARAERAKVSEVFAELRGFDSGNFRERIAGNGLDTLLFQWSEAAQVSGETINRLARDLRFADLLQARQRYKLRAFG